jgi:hypothetical protein
VPEACLCGSGLPVHARGFSGVRERYVLTPRPSIIELGCVHFASNERTEETSSDRTKSKILQRSPM